MISSNGEAEDFEVVTPADFVRVYPCDVPACENKVERAVGAPNGASLWLCRHHVEGLAARLDLDGWVSGYYNR